MYKYKTKNGNDCVIPGVGETKDGYITTQVKLESPNLELVSTDTEAPAGHVQAVAPQAAQAAPQPVAPPQPTDQPTEGAN